MSTLPPQSPNSFFSAVTYPSVAFQPYVPTSVVVPASGAYAVANDNANITTYPPEDDKMEYTYASYGEDPSGHIFKLSPNNPDSWTLSLSIPTPTKLSKPVLRSLTYIIKYATAHDDGNSTVQADVVLTSATCPIGILSKSTDHGVYRNGPGYGPRMVDSAKALCLSSASAIKCNGGTSQWSHCIDHRRLLPNVQVVDSANLYLNFHVFEYPTAETRRYLAIEVSATWCDNSEVPGGSSDDESTEDEDSDVEEVAMLTAAKTEREKEFIPSHTSPPHQISSISPPTASPPHRMVSVSPPTVSPPHRMVGITPPSPRSRMASIPPSPHSGLVSIPPSPHSGLVCIPPSPHSGLVSIPPSPHSGLVSIPPSPRSRMASIPPSPLLRMVSVSPPTLSSPLQVVSDSPPTPSSPHQIFSDSPPTPSPLLRMVSDSPPAPSSPLQVIGSSPPPTVSAAPQIADQGMQDLIKAKTKGSPSQNCPNGFGWEKTDTGYVCEGGAHHITFAQLGMKS